MKKSGMAADEGRRSNQRRDGAERDLQAGGGGGSTGKSVDLFEHEARWTSRGAVCTEKGKTMPDARFRHFFSGGNWQWMFVRGKCITGVSVVASVIVIR